MLSGDLGSIQERTLIIDHRDCPRLAGMLELDARSYLLLSPPILMPAFWATGFKKLKATDSGPTNRSNLLDIDNERDGFLFQVSKWHPAKGTEVDPCRLCCLIDGRSYGGGMAVSGSGLGRDSGLDACLQALNALTTIQVEKQCGPGVASRKADT